MKDKLKKIKFAIDKISNNPRYSGLHTHKNETFRILNNIEVFQSYAENNTPGAYRIFWHYGPNKEDITIISIVQHP